MNLMRLDGERAEKCAIVISRDLVVQCFKDYAEVVVSIARLLKRTKMTMRDIYTSLIFFYKPSRGLTPFPEKIGID